MEITYELRKIYCLHVNNYKYGGGEKPLGYGGVGY
jgi:hypothetical protein